MDDFHKSLIVSVVIVTIFAGTLGVLAAIKSEMKRVRKEEKNCRQKAS